MDQMVFRNLLTGKTALPHDLQQVEHTVEAEQPLTYCTSVAPNLARRQSPAFRRRLRRWKLAFFSGYRAAGGAPGLCAPGLLHDMQTDERWLPQHVEVFTPIPNSAADNFEIEEVIAPTGEELLQKQMKSIPVLVELPHAEENAAELQKVSVTQNQALVPQIRFSVPCMDTLDLSSENVSPVQTLDKDTGLQISFEIPKKGMTKGLGLPRLGFFDFEDLLPLGVVSSKHYGWVLTEFEDWATSFRSGCSDACAESGDEFGDDDW